MLQSNLIFGIQKRIKEGSKHASKLGLIQESGEVSPEVKTKASEPILESSFMSGIYEKAAGAKKKEEVKKSLITEAFHLTKAKKKLEKDIVYFNYLYENYVPDVFKEQYETLLESIFEDTIRLYQEADVTPRLISQALDTNELNESQIVDIYKNRLNETIKNEYTKPLLSGKISELYENEIRDLTKKLITENADIDMGQVKVYLPFEETVYKFNKEILVPEIAQSRIESFMESVTEEYLQFIEESAADILQAIEKKIKLLTSMISPDMFDKAVDAEDVDAPKMAGISITIDKNFNSDEDCDDGICPDEVASMDPEAAEEMADEEEAEELEDMDEDLVGKENEVRDDMELATDSEDYEDTDDMEEEAEESAAEETDEVGEHPGATELGLELKDGDLDPESGLATNDSDTALSGEGNDEGVDPNGESATLPGDVDNIGTDIDSDDIGDEIDELQAKEEVDSDDSELGEDEEDELEDVSEEKSTKDKETISEGTIQDKKPSAQNAPNKSGSMDSSPTTKDINITGAKGAGNSKTTMPGGGTKDDKSLSKGQGGAPKSKGSMPGGGTKDDKSISKAKNTGNSRGSMDSSPTTKDINIAGAQGGASNSKTSMPGGGTTQDKNLSKKRG